jgi:hypothetical protein
MVMWAIVLLSSLFSLDYKFHSYLKLLGVDVFYWALNKWLNVNQEKYVYHESMWQVTK